MNPSPAPTPRRRSAPSAPPGARILRIGLSVGMVFALLIFAAAGERLLWSGKVLPGVAVADVSAGAKSEQDLATALAPVAQQLERRVYTAVTDRGRFRATAEELGVRADIDAAVRAARRSGRSGNPLDAAVGVIARRIRDNAVELPVRHDDEALDATLDRWDRAARSGVRNAGITVTTTGRGSSTRAEVSTVPAVAGLGIDREVARARLLDAMRSPSAETTFGVPTVPARPTVGDAAAARAAARARAVLTGTYAVRSDGVSFTLGVAQLAPALRAVPRGNELELRIDQAALRARLDPEVAASARPARDASFRVNADNSVSVVPSVDGRGPDLAAISRAVLAGQRDIVAPLAASHPERDTAWANRLGITELVAVFTTRHACCQPRVTNIHTAAKLVDDTVIEPGQVFALNDIVGPRTVERGFVQAPVFYGEFTEDVGGGVSQVATTTFNAAFWGGFEIVTHKPHSIYIDRYPMGREATVSYPGLDLKWKNDSRHGVLVKTSFTSTSVTVALYGNREGKRVRETLPSGCSVGPIVDVKYDPRCIEILSTTPVTQSILQCPPDNPADDPRNRCAQLAAGAQAPGASGHAGYKVVFYRTITRPGVAPVVEKFSWTYRMIPDVVLEGTAATAPSTTVPGPTTVPGATTTTGAGVPTTTTRP